MNGKLSKLLRRLAGVNKESQASRSYRGVESKKRRKVSKEYRIDPLTFEVSEIVTGEIITTTYVMNQSPRVLYKTLKKGFSFNTNLSR